MTVIIEPEKMAVSIEDARTAARENGTALDGEIEMWVRAFTKSAEHETGRAIIDQTHRVTLDRFPKEIELPASPVQSVVVKFLDIHGVEQTLDPADYILDNARAPCYVVPAPGKSWPATAARINAVKVDALCGYGPDHTTTPAGFKAFILGRLQEKYTPGATESPHLCRSLWPYKVF
jgi:uncharacterized phiE125 gp8 family phage protein